MMLVAGNPSDWAMMKCCEASLTLKRMQREGFCERLLWSQCMRMEGRSPRLISDMRAELEMGGMVGLLKSERRGCATIG